MEHDHAGALPPIADDPNAEFARLQDWLTEGRLDDALRRTIEILETRGSSPEVRGNCAGILIDIGSAQRAASPATRGVDILRDLIARSSTPAAKRSFTYNLANGLSTLGALEVQASGWSYWGLATNERVQEAKLLLLDLLEDTGQSPTPEAWVNHANGLSQLGRSIEALFAYDQALRLDADHPMAKGNKGEALMTIAPLLGVSFSETLWEAGRLMSQAIQDPRLSAIGTVGAGKSWRTCVARIEAQLRTTFTGNESPRHAPASLDALAPGTRRFVVFCRDERLFLTYHVLDEYADAALRDAVFIRTFEPVGQVDRFAHLATLFNQIKEDYAVARYQLFLATERDADRDAISGHTIYANVGEGAVFHLYAGLLKSAFGQAFNVLDKIAFFMNAYLSLGIAEEQVFFRKFWRHPADVRPQRPGIEYRVRQELRDRENGPIVAIVDIARDLERERFKATRDIRHAQTHRVLVLTKSGDSPHPRPGVQAIPWTRMRAETLQLLLTVKAAIFSLAAVVTEEEGARRNAVERSSAVRRDVPTDQDFDLPTP